MSIYNLYNANYAIYVCFHFQLSSSGGHLFCQCGNQVQVLHVETGWIEHTVGQVS